MLYNRIKSKLLIGIISFSVLYTGCSSNSNASIDVENNVEQEVTTEVQQSSSNDSKTETNDASVEEEEGISDFGNVQISFLDTGNSDAILIKENEKAMLIDAGDRDDDSLLTKQLKEKGVTELEYFIVTHPHADHLGAADAVLKNFKVNNLFVSNGDADTQVYRDFIEAAANKGINPSVPLEGSQFLLGKSYFKVLNTNGGPDTNNYSLVVQFYNGEDKALFMGDAEKEVEEKLLNKVEKVGLLKAGHHGSHSSSTQSFINKISNPDTIVAIQVGANNKYGHPHREPMELFKSKGLEVHRNDTCGTIDIVSTGSGFTTDCKKGGYETGNDNSSSKNSDSKNENSYNYSSSESYNKPLSNNDVSENNDLGKDNNSQVQTDTNQSGVIYYTPNGKSYHTTKSCSSLSRSKKILSGSISSSGKSDPCDRCN